MHISIFVYGTWGDIRPHVVLGMALQKAGHTVQVVASQGYESWIRSRNLDFYSLSTDADTFARENAGVLDENVIRQFQIMRKSMRPNLVRTRTDVLEATRKTDVLITGEFGISFLFDIIKVNKLRSLFINTFPLSFSRDVPSVITPPAPDWLPLPQLYNRMSHSMVRRMQWLLFGQSSSSYKEFQAFVDAASALTIVSQHVFPRPLDWRENWQVTGYLFDDDPDWTPPQDLLDFLNMGEPPVYIGFGSMPDSKPETTTRTVIEAVQRTGKRAIILTGWAGLGAENVQENIHILKYAPHSWLFPRTAAVIHHGGAGTTAAGFRAGVPTIIAPHTADQPYWGRRAQELGVGTAPIPRKKLTVENLAAAINQATTIRTMQTNAKALGEKIRQEDGLGETVKWVERFLSI
ncbi:MAG: glycosyltransferase [Pleurocapsa minor GSE-CHR-MK-17-07R]|jgi:UDP:flavonoid glycosyltransferase YjiC (YdhE family)|nr:glycosyltransferase [Pleurocapsa minor GSE-CHR-MK 17-07R]